MRLLLATLPLCAITAAAVNGRTLSVAGTRRGSCQSAAEDAVSCLLPFFLLLTTKKTAQTFAGTKKMRNFAFDQELNLVLKHCFCCARAVGDEFRRAVCALLHTSFTVSQAREIDTYNPNYKHKTYEQENLPETAVEGKSPRRRCRHGGGKYLHVAF